MITAAPCGRFVPTGRQIGDPLARSASWLPRGCCRAQRIFQNDDCRGQSYRNEKAAERSEADEGWRQVDSGMQLDEWYLFQFSPFNVLL